MKNKFFDAFNDLLFPRRCPICDEIVKAIEVCDECSKKVSYIRQPVCFKCGKQLEEDEREFCHDCTIRKFSYKRGVAAFSYSDGIKRSMYAFKYNNRREYADYYAATLVREFGNVIKSFGAEVLIPVPLHSKKLCKRGYNQAEVLARHISRLINIPVDDNFITRIRNTVPQKELKEKERIDNIKNAFQIRNNSLKYNKIILVDDIYTTGTTIDECAGTALAAGVSEVYFVTACIGKGF